MKIKPHFSATSTRKAFVSDTLQRVAPLIGATVEIEPEYGFVGMITFASGKRVLYKDRNFNINPQGASEIARDKGYTSYFLRRFGYQTPRDITVFSKERNARLDRPKGIQDGLEFARSLGYPVIVKPHNLSQGALVQKVYNDREFRKAAKLVLARCHVMVVQEFAKGRDFRLVVLDKEVISAYERIPLSVLGDGIRSIEALLTAKQASFESMGRDTTIDHGDSRMSAVLRRNGLSMQSIPKNGEQITLLDIANLSSGGDAVDFTDSLHEDFRRLAVSVARDLELRLCGVDVICPDGVDQASSQYSIIEVNSAPGLDNYASIGDRQVAIVDELYLKVLCALERTSTASTI